MNDIRDIRHYKPEIVEFSKSILIEICAFLKEYRENFVLVGWWVPYFLLDRYKDKDAEFEHIGSIDIDIALNPEGLPDLDKVYESIRSKIERNGYQMRRTKEGNPIPYSFEKAVQNQFIRVDFLASEYRGSDYLQGLEDIHEILAVRLKGIEIAFLNNENFEIEGNLPSGATHRVQLKVANITALLTMKSFAFESSIDRIKDVYDIYSILRYIKNGVISVISEVRTLYGNRTVKNAITKLASVFSTVDSVGPYALADFLLPEQRGSEDWEFYRRDVFELVQEFLQGLH